MANEPETRTILRAVLVVVAVAITLVLIWLLREPITWIILAVFLATALSGPVNYLNRFMKRGFAILLILIGLVLVPIGLGAIVIPPVVNGAADLVNHAPQYASDFQDSVQQNDRLQALDDKYQIGDKIQQKADRLPEILGDAAGVLADIGGGVFSSLAALATIVVMAVFMLAGGGRWIDWFIAQQPKRHQARYRRVLKRSNRAIGNYLAGNIAISVIAAVSAYVVMLILNIPYAAPLAVMVGLLDLIPMVGSLLAGVMVGIVSLFVDFPTATIVWIIWMVVYQQVENNLIQPQVQRRSVDISPLVVIIAILFGSTLFGLLGALLAIPFAATIQIILKEWWDYRKPARA